MFRNLLHVPKHKVLHRLFFQLTSHLGRLQFHALLKQTKKENDINTF